MEAPKLLFCQAFHILPPSQCTPVATILTAATG